MAKSQDKEKGMLSLKEVTERCVKYVKETFSIEEVCISYPVMIMRGNQFIDMFFIYTHDDENASPLWWIGVDSNTGSICISVSTTESDLVGTVSQLSYKTVNFSYSELADTMNQYGELREKMFASSISVREREVIYRYLELIASSDYDELSRCYKMLSSSTIAWLGDVSVYNDCVDPVANGVLSILSEPINTVGDDCRPLENVGIFTNDDLFEDLSVELSLSDEDDFDDDEDYYADTEDDCDDYDDEEFIGYGDI